MEEYRTTASENPQDEQSTNGSMTNLAVPRLRFNRRSRSHNTLARPTRLRGSRQTLTNDPNLLQLVDKENEILPSFMVPYKSLFSMLSKSGMIKQKTQYCRHRSKSCYKNAVLAFLKYFCYAFVTKTMLAGLAEITGLRFNIMKVIKAMVSSKAINSSFCIASFATAYKLLM